jgi:predicted amidophosphoribosyltransferase
MFTTQELLKYNNYNLPLNMFSSGSDLSLDEGKMQVSDADVSAAEDEVCQPVKKKKYLCCRCHIASETFWIYCPDCREQLNREKRKKKRLGKKVFQVKKDFVFLKPQEVVKERHVDHNYMKRRKEYEKFVVVEAKPIKGKRIFSEICQLCKSAKKDASFLHGRITHQVFCYDCAKKFHEHYPLCPVCYRRIEKVLKNIVDVE